MSPALDAYFEALRKARLAFHMAEIKAHRVAAAELRLTDEHSSASELTDAEHMFAFACRDVVTAVDGLPDGKRPRGWDS